MKAPTSTTALSAVRLCRVVACAATPRAEADVKDFTHLEALDESDSDKTQFAGVGVAMYGSCLGSSDHLWHFSTLSLFPLSEPFLGVASRHIST